MSADPLHLAESLSLTPTTYRELADEPAPSNIDYKVNIAAQENMPTNNQPVSKNWRLRGLSYVLTAMNVAATVLMILNAIQFGKDYSDCPENCKVLGQDLGLAWTGVVTDIVQTVLTPIMIHTNPHTLLDCAAGSFTVYRSTFVLLSPLPRFAIATKLVTAVVEVATVAIWFPRLFPKKNKP